MKRVSVAEDISYNFLYMNLESIYQDLKSFSTDYLPRRYKIALMELKKLNNICICIADKGGKVALLNKVSYNGAHAYVVIRSFSLL